VEIVFVLSPVKLTGFDTCMGPPVVRNPVLNVARDMVDPTREAVDTRIVEKDWKVATLPALPRTDPVDNCEALMNWNVVDQFAVPCTDPVETSSVLTVTNVTGPPWMDPVDSKDVLKEVSNVFAVGKKNVPVLNKFISKEPTLTGIVKLRGPFINKDPVLAESKATDRWAVIDVVES
jgi:hypothetical protein